MFSIGDVVEYGGSRYRIRETQVGRIGSLEVALEAWDPYLENWSSIGGYHPASWFKLVERATRVKKIQRNLPSWW